MIAMTIASEWHSRRLIMRKAAARGGLGCALRRAIMGVLALVAAAPVMAEDRAEMITASNPAGIIIAMLNAGHNPELKTDRTGDPMIVSRGPKASLFVLFYGCSAETHDNCQSIRFQVAFDRAKPWSPQEAMKLADDLAFLSVRLDNEGDPFLHWDLVLGDGMPITTFVRNLRAFEESVTLAADIIHAEEKAELMRQQ